MALYSISYTKLCDLLLLKVEEYLDILSRLRFNFSLNPTSAELFWCAYFKTCYISKIVKERERRREREKKREDSFGILTLINSIRVFEYAFKNFIYYSILA